MELIVFVTVALVEHVEDLSVLNAQIPHFGGSRSS